MNTIALRVSRSLAAAAIATLIWFGSGCASNSSGGALTLKELDTNVGWKMTAFQTVDPLGGIPANQEQQVRAAHQDYQQAYRQAVAAAGGNLNAPAPSNLVQQANQLINLISAVLGNP